MVSRRVRTDDFQVDDLEVEQHTAPDNSKRRRLRQKASPTVVPAFPQRALLRSAECKVRKAQLKKAQLAQRKTYRSVHAQAVELLSKQVPLHRDVNDDNVLLPLQTPHPSHWITTMNGDSNVIWCKSCGCWSLSQKLRGLAEGCKGLAVGQRSTLRLLQCGVRPGPNARLPPKDVKVRRRKGRW